MMRKKYIRLGGEKISAIIITIFFLPFYVFFQTSSIYGGDAGDLVTAAYLHGVPHPPGYPLYTLIGWLLTLLPISTVAWRVTLLSSTPSALTLGFLFLIIVRFTKKFIPSAIAVTTFGFTYLFWLYAIVPEVFALHSLFVVLIFYVLLQFKETRNVKWFWAGCFTLGLSLTHHHTIVFMVPAYAYLVYPTLRKIKIQRKQIFQALLLTGLGLVPYIYVTLASLTQPAINWENPVTMKGIVRLASRAMYGSFRSNRGLGLDPRDRYLALKVAAETTLIDFTGAGIILAAIGAIWQYRKERYYFNATMIAFLTTGPVFTFYASFPVLQNFNIATAERFLLVPYLFICIWIAYGIVTVSMLVDKIIKRVAPNIALSSVIIFGLLPVLLLLTNYPRMSQLKNDRTAELLAEDILKTVPDHAVLFLYNDVPLFNTQYLYFNSGGRNLWRDIKLIHTGMLGADFYKIVLTRQYPDIDFSFFFSDTGGQALTQFADKYIDTNQIMSDTPIPVDDKKYGWIPEGLLYRLYKNTLPREPISIEDYIARVEPLMASYQNPLSGVLGSYKHVMLADVLRIYAEAFDNSGSEFLSAMEYEKAERYFRTALTYAPQKYSVNINLAKALMGQQKCFEAEETLNAYVKVVYNDPLAYQQLAILYKSCLKDDQKADDFEKLYSEKKLQTQTTLENY